MKKTNLNRYSPLQLKKDRYITNRVVIPAMASQTANSEGFATEATKAHYQRLSLAGAGLIFLEYTYVNISGRSENNQLGIYSDLHVEGLAQIAHIIKVSGALAGIQLTHAGGKTSSNLTDGQLLGPSNIAVPVKNEILEAPTPMSKREIHNLIECFVLAAKRAHKAGFDLIELHSAHGYGLNQWVSPITNKRQDDFGGPLVNRLRLLSIIIEKIKLECPGLMISVRIPGQDHLDGGLTTDNGIHIARHLESIGVDIINVSSGIGGWRRPRERIGQGYLVPEAALIQRYVQTPVIGVGGIESGEFIDKLINSETLQLAAVGRAILNNPAEWGLKNLKHKLNEDGYEQ